MVPFGVGDIGERVRFFKSPLYKDFVESRVSKLLEFAQKCAEQQQREQALETAAAMARGGSVGGGQGHVVGVGKPLGVRAGV